MGIVKMDEEGVEALKTLAQALPDAIDGVAEAASGLRSSFEDKKELLGPHTAEIEQILELVDEAQSSGQSSVLRLSLSFMKSAIALSAIIDKGFSKSR